VKEKLLRTKYSSLLYSSKVSLDHKALTLEFPFQYEKYELLDKMKMSFLTSVTSKNDPAKYFQNDLRLRDLHEEQICNGV
jgi:hypothetical protein